MKSPSQDLPPPVFLLLHLVFHFMLLWGYVYRHITGLDIPTQAPGRVRVKWMVIGGRGLLGPEFRSKRILPLDLFVGSR